MLSMTVLRLSAKLYFPAACNNFGRELSLKKAQIRLQNASLLELVQDRTLQSCTRENISIACATSVYML